MFSKLWEIWGCDESGWHYPQRIAVAYTWQEAIAEKNDCIRYGYTNVEVREHSYIPDLNNWEGEYADA